MAPKRKQSRRQAELSDDVYEQERPARRARHSTLPPSKSSSGSTILSPSKSRHDEYGPKIRIPMILHYLQDNDIDHTANWSSSLENIIAYLEYADELRRCGHKDFDAKLQGDLFDCQVVLGVHRAYEKWNRGQTPYSETKLPAAQPHSRLSWYDRLLPISKKTRASPASSRISLIPREGDRNKSPFHLFANNHNPQLYDIYFQTTRGQMFVKTLTMLHRDESLLWHADSTTTPLSRPAEPNLSELENHAYEESVSAGIDEMGKHHPAYHPSDIENERGDVENTVRERGWLRAALQQVLQLFDNEENREVNTPWRRVALPAPVKERRELAFHTAAKLKNSVEPDDGVKGVVTRGIGHSSEEPSPWVYWFNEYLEQSKVLSSYARRNYMLKMWNQSSAVAIPPNFQGPYTFSGRCVYEDNWLKVGKECVLLRRNLKRAAGMYEPNCRFLPTIISDIEQGLSGHAPDTSLRPRPNVDYDPAKSNTFLLLDEFDMAWLKYLMEPGYAPGLIKYSNKTPQDNLLILFDHRIQTLFNDTHQNMFWAKQASAEHYKGFPRYTSQKVPLTELLTIINRGGRKLLKEKGHLAWKASDLNDHDPNPPNTLYQFSLEEARFACIKLARLGRLFYEGPILEDVNQYVDTTDWDDDTHCRFYQTSDKSDWGHVGVHKTEIFPEQRIIWRHEDDKSFVEFNRDYKKHTRGIFQDNIEEGRPKSFAAETIFKVGTYPEGGFEAARQSPIWEDIVPIDVAAAQELGVSERSSQFFRNLAFRLGRTIRHYQQLQQRSSKSVGLPRKELKSELQQWNDTVKNVKTTAKAAGYMPIRVTQMTDIIPRAAPGHPASASKDLTAIFTTIRKGLIDDAVENRTQTYPSRAVFQIDEDGRKVKTYQRQNVWGWSDKTIREHHAPYLRERYFDVRRWPLHRQSEATQKKIRTREDEHRCLQPPLAWYRYGIRAGPVSQGSLVANADNSIINVLPATQQLAASELVKKFKQALVVSMRNANVSINDDWEFIINPPIRDAWSLVPSSQTLQPIVRPTSKFIPGPPHFPMGDTLLKQIQISQELETILDPKPQNLGSILMDKFTSWFAPEPERIPLLPEIDTNRAPRSNPRKRRLPSAFLSEIEPAQKVAALSHPFNANIPARAKQHRGVRGTPLIESDQRQRPPARALLGGVRSDTSFADLLNSTEEREYSRREKVETVAALLRAKVVDQDELAARSSTTSGEPVAAPPAWKVKSKAQDVRKPDEVPTVEIVRNEDGASGAVVAEDAKPATKRVAFDLPNNEKGDKGFAWPASVPRPRYSILQENGKEIVVIDQEDLGELEKAVRVPLSEWPATELAPHSIILRVNPSRQWTVEEVQRAFNPLANPVTEDSSADEPKRVKYAPPGFAFGSKSPVGTPVTPRFPNPASAMPGSRRGSSRSSTSTTTTGTGTTPATSIDSSRRGSRSAATPQAETVEFPTGQVVDISGVPAFRRDGTARHIYDRGFVALRDAAFPHGYQVVPTPGRDNHCGIYAMVISVRRQYPTALEPPTYAALLALGRDDPRVQARLAALGGGDFSSSSSEEGGAFQFNAEANFSVDMLAAMLEGWGRAHGVRLHLGVVYTEKSRRDPWVILNEHPQDAASDYVVWIHSNESAPRGRRDGMTDREVIEEDQRLEGMVTNHFSGLQPNAPPKGSTQPGTRSSQRLRQK